MKFEENISKIKKAIQHGLDNIDKMISEFLPVETILKSDHAVSTTCFVPQISNLHYPNIFLRNDVNTACKSFLVRNKEERDFGNEVNIILDGLEQFDFDNSTDSTIQLNQVDVNKLSEIFNKRYGL